MMTDTPKITTLKELLQYIDKWVYSCGDRKLIDWHINTESLTKPPPSIATTLPSPIPPIPPYTTDDEVPF